MSGPEAIMGVVVFAGGFWLLGPIARAAAELTAARSWSRCRAPGGTG
jgi:hypothetical protein